MGGASSLRQPRCCRAGATQPQLYRCWLSVLSISRCVSGMCLSCNDLATRRWGLFIAAAASLQGWGYAAVASPLFSMLVICRMSGIPMLERYADKKWGADPAYQARSASVLQQACGACCTVHLTCRQLLGCRLEQAVNKSGPDPGIVGMHHA